LRIVRLPTVLRPGVLFQVSRFSSVRAHQVRVGHVLRSVQASEDRCIPRAPALRVRVPWELVQGCRLRERQRVRAAVRVVQRVVPVNVTFLVA
jgi:hypothetical protein